MQTDPTKSGFTVSLDTPSSREAPAAAQPDAAAQAPAEGPAGAPAATAPHRSFRARRRNRHDRGLRGELLLPALPGSHTRAEKFDALVVDSADRMLELWPKELAHVEFLVEEIPDELEALMGTSERVPLGRFRPAGPVEPAGITVFRRPVESLVDTDGQLRDLVHEVVIEQVAGLLGMPPESVDPMYRKYRH
ncbi:metallopeptidase family protein [Arthrobacter sp. 35W]|uniref:metallopeptidase family protein n=1 Tax=Arthrobacter sp. 35W TaxID=1132441 RepID=UPI0003F64755|nr:metallopeptidase family protein [Arthrobacter sp. 35W]